MSKRRREKQGTCSSTSLSPDAHDNASSSEAGMETYDHRLHYPVDSSRVLEEFGTMFFAGVTKSEFGLPSMINNYCSTDNRSTQLRRYVEVGCLRHPGDGDCTNGW